MPQQFAGIAREMEKLGCLGGKDSAGWINFDEETKYSIKCAGRRIRNHSQGAGRRRLVSHIAYGIRIDDHQNFAEPRFAGSRHSAQGLRRPMASRCTRCMDGYCNNGLLNHDDAFQEFGW